MFLENIDIVNYKNIETCRLDFSPRLNCFVGRNGMGKTNLLDSIFYLSFCKSSIGTPDSSNILHSADTMMIKGKYNIEGEVEEIHCGVQPQVKKQIKRNGKQYGKISEHVGMIPLVLIAPSAINIVIGGSEERRRFLDSVISQYDKKYLQNLIAYNRVLSQRNKILKTNPNDELLMIFSEQMLSYAQYIHEQRKIFSEEIIPTFQRFYNDIGEKESVSLSYQSKLNTEDFIELTNKNLEKDKILKHTTIGIHRDDISLKINGYTLKREGSQGQKKSFLIALKFAQYDFIKKATGKLPLLLLDDIFDKLDSQRVTNIIKLITKQEFGQTFITDTDKNHINSIVKELATESTVFYVEDGKIENYD